MDNEFKKKYLKSIVFMSVFNVLGGALFLFSFYLSQITAFLWAGLIVIVLTAVLLIWFFLKFAKL
ncbi:MAG: hypothetical protein A2X64_05270 [Ignavibacteria bacterium GWF2_33_9]|nr:MAG: hypothetical protein A2X64_05270 [Ignavibacteria bacterium GWF2_33_9]